MQPKKTKEFVTSTAQKLGIPEELVKDAIDFYYEEVRRNLTQMNESVLCLGGFGTFKAKPKELVKLKLKLKDQLETMGVPKTPARIKIKQDVETRLGNILKIEKKISAENKRKHEFYEAKRNGTQLLYKDLEKQKKDLKRARKQNFQNKTNRENGSSQSSDL